MSYSYFPVNKLEWASACAVGSPTLSGKMYTKPKVSKVDGEDSILFPAVYFGSIFGLNFYRYRQVCDAVNEAGCEVLGFTRHFDL